MRKRKKRNPGDRYVGLPHYLLKCDAYKTLPGDAVKTLIDVWSRHNGVNNGEISYGVREAKSIGVHHVTASRMLTLLIEHGFLVIVRDSAFTVKNRLVRTWRLTAEPYRGEQGTKEFMRWKTPDSFTAEPVKPAQRGRDSFSLETVRTEQNLKHSFTTETDSFIRETPRNKITSEGFSTETVRPKKAVSQFHHRNTYRLPWGEAPPVPTDAIGELSPDVSRDAEPGHPEATAPPPADHQHVPETPVGADGKKIVGAVEKNRRENDDADIATFEPISFLRKQVDEFHPEGCDVVLLRWRADDAKDRSVALATSFLRWAKRDAKRHRAAAARGDDHRLDRSAN